MKVVDTCYCPDTVNKRSYWTVGLESNSDHSLKSVADPGFTFGEALTSWVHQPPKWVLFGRNVYENERIGSRCGGDAPRIRQWKYIIFDYFLQVPFCKRVQGCRSIISIKPLCLIKF